jgi:hypothetical protein
VSARDPDAVIAAAPGIQSVPVAGNVIRDSQSLAPAQSVSWQETEIRTTNTAPPEGEQIFDWTALPVTAIRPISTPSTSVQADYIMDVLNDAGERILLEESLQPSVAAFGTGIVATTGYVLFNSRIGLWMLSLLSSRPLWKQFDPLEVLYAWDEDAREDGAKEEDRETLASLVD